MSVAYRAPESDPVASAAVATEAATRASADTAEASARAAADAADQAAIAAEAATRGADVDDEMTRAQAAEVAESAARAAAISAEVAARDAAIATHAGLKRSVHGFPASVGSGQGLVGDGSGGWSAVDLATQAEQDAALAAFNAPYVKVGMTAVVAAGNNAVVTLAFNIETEDTDNQHDNTTANSRITCVKNGVYYVSAMVEWAANTTGRRILQISKNGESASLRRSLGATPIFPTQSTGLDQIVSGPLRLVVGDYLETVVFQNSGGNLNVGGGDSFMAMLWLRS